MARKQKSAMLLLADRNSCKYNRMAKPAVPFEVQEVIVSSIFLSQIAPSQGFCWVLTQFMPLELNSYMGLGLGPCRRRLTISSSIYSWKNRGMV